MLPALFISHGTPALPFTDTPAKRFLSGLSGILPQRPRAILAVSPRWDEDDPPVPRGFAYRAPAAPSLAGKAADLLRAAGLSGQPGPENGAQVPLSLIYPQADIPVVQLSVARGHGPLRHIAMGNALAPLRRDDGVLILGSGSFTRGRPLSPRPDAPEPPWVAEFARWMHRALRNGSLGDLLSYRTKAPFAERNHPSDEHLMPLFVAMGAGGAKAEATRLHASTMHGVLRMDVYAFKNPKSAP